MYICTEKGKNMLTISLKKQKLLLLKNFAYLTTKFRVVLHEIQSSKCVPL